jgi:hypothetical protein
MKDKRLIIIGKVGYNLNQVITASIARMDLKGRPIDVELLVPNSDHPVLHLYDEEALTFWEVYTADALDTTETLARHFEELQGAFEEGAHAQGDLDLHQPPQYTYVYTPEDVQTYLDVSRALDCVKDRDITALVEQGLVKPDDLRTWSIIAQALSLASFYIRITDWDTDRVEVHRLPGETPHGQWKEWVGDGAATRLIAKTLTDVER